MYISLPWKLEMINNIPHLEIQHDSMHAFWEQHTRLSLRNELLWNHCCSRGIDVCGFSRSPLPMNLRVLEPLFNNPNFQISTTKWLASLF